MPRDSTLGFCCHLDVLHILAKRQVPPTRHMSLLQCHAGHHWPPSHGVRVDACSAIFWSFPGNGWRQRQYPTHLDLSSKQYPRPVEACLLQRQSCWYGRHRWHRRRNSLPTTRLPQLRPGIKCQHWGECGHSNFGGGPEYLLQEAK